MIQISRVKWFGLVFGVLLGCSPVETPTPAVGDGLGDSSDRQADGARATVDRQTALLAGIPDVAHKAVCQSGRFRCKARVQTSDSGQIRSFAGVALAGGFGPADLQNAYKLDTSVDPGVTVAIVDAFGYPNAESDLAKYRSTYGLPPCTVASGCLTIVNQDGKTSPLPPAPDSANDWTVEAALDLDLVSAACPKCKILYVQAQDNTGDGLFIAQNAAANLGAIAVSNSWGGPDDGTGINFEVYFNHPGMGVFVASGDSGNTGATPDYPSTSAFVTAVGGTSLVKAAGSARGWTEGAWSGSGSSCSKTIAKPAYQKNSVCAFRADADVSAVGNPSTGLAVYNNGPSSSGWIVVGGTSASCPFVAGAYALTGHGAAGPAFSYANGADFFDVTSGSNGSCNTLLCKAGAGWDGPTGNGTPNGAALKSTTCTPTCVGKQCGGDGCGGSCGTCASGQVCSANGTCQTSCTPSCSGKQCGSDGCGGTCGTCASGQVCDANGTCQASCTPSCSGKQCGSDGCGGTCGTCAAGTTCNGSGQCVGSGGCSHPICSTGSKLTSSCDVCAGKICAKDSYCCNTAWDSLCVREVASICGQSCSAGGCAHSVCSTGAKLTTSCDVCAGKICAQDSFCCNVGWDSQCVSEVSSICGQSC